MLQNMEQRGTIVRRSAIEPRADEMLSENEINQMIREELKRMPWQRAEESDEDQII